MDNVTSVVIPVSEEYQAIKNETKPNKKLGIEGQTQDIKQKILGSAYSKATKRNLIRIYDEIGSEVFFCEPEYPTLFYRFSIINRELVGVQYRKRKFLSFRKN